MFGIPRFEVGFTPKRKKKIVKEKMQGYHGEVKEKGKWKRVTKKPRTLTLARAIAANVTDNTTAVSLRVIKARKNAVKGPKMRTNMNKFKDFSLRGKKKTTLSNHGLIEKKSARIDTRGEKNQLSVGKYMKSKMFATKRKRRKR